MKRLLAIALPLIGILAAIVWLRVVSSIDVTQSTSRDQDRGAVEPPRSKVDQNQLREVNATVAEKNREVSREREAFEKDGWKFVEVAPPDQNVIGYQPSLLDSGRENDLKMQLHSTVPGPDSVARVAEIARRAKHAETRYAAVQALGRLNAPQATEALYDLLLHGELDPSDDARKQIAPLLRPASLDDPLAQKIAALLDSSALSAIERKQIAFTLSLIGLRDGMTLDAQTLSTLSPQARQLLEQMIVIAQNALTSAHPHVNPEGGLQ